jgi:hypothetical protein
MNPPMIADFTADAAMQPATQGCMVGYQDRQQECVNKKRVLWLGDGENASASKSPSQEAESRGRVKRPSQEAQSRGAEKARTD